MTMRVDIRFIKDGETVANPIVELDDETAVGAADAAAWAIGWPDTIKNENGDEVPNPLNRWWALATMWRQRTSQVMAAHLRHKSIAPVVQSVADAVEQADAAITVIDGAAE